MVEPPDPAPITCDEINALRYAAGFVPAKLRTKFRKRRPEFMVWLNCMNLNGTEEETGTYLDYTRKWIRAVNRGGLFEVNDKAFRLFVELEMKVREFLPRLLKPPGCTDDWTKKSVLDEITEDDDVELSWAVLTVEFDDKELSAELLRLIAELWLTIRGFSAAGAWLEYYKQCTESNTSKEHALRKTLRRDTLQASAEDEPYIITNHGHPQKPLDSTHHIIIVQIYFYYTLPVI